MKEVEHDGGKEPSVVLFPLSYSESSQSGLPREIRISAKQRLANLPMKTSQPVQASTIDEIATLRRRLEQIKERRAVQRERTLELQRNEEHVMDGNPYPTPARHPRSHQINPSQQPGATTSPDGRRPSLTSETAGETIDTSLTSSTVSMLHPRRLFCSTYKPKSSDHIARRIYYSDEEAPNPRNPRRETTPPENPLSDPEGEVSMNLLESLVCVRPSPDDPLDLKVCGGRLSESRMNYGSSTDSRSEHFDPYQSRGNFKPDEAEMTLRDIPRGRAYSLVGEEEKTTAMTDERRFKSCMPISKRFPTWYDRPDAIQTNHSDIHSRVMELVYYSKDPNPSLDEQMKICSRRSFD